MDAELKSLLELILAKVGQIDELRAKVDELSAKVDELGANVDELGAMRPKVDQIAEIRAKVDRIEETLPTLAAKADIARLEDEQRQIKEMLGTMRLREIGRLDGRIDQLTMEFNLFRKSDAA